MSLYKYYTLFSIFLEAAVFSFSDRLWRAFPFIFMRVEHFEKDISYNAEELLLLAKKIGRLATYCRFLKDEGSSIRVEAEKRDTKKDRDQVKVMVTVRLPKEIFRVESRKNLVMEAIDSCMEKLEEQVKRYKEMHTGRARAHQAARKRKSMDLAA